MEEEKCFAYKYNFNKEKYECSALEEAYCDKGENCPFYKPFKKWLEEKEKSERHLLDINFKNPYV